jgi:hypothetical protein
MIALRSILLYGLVFTCSNITAQSGEFEAEPGRNKVSLDIFSLLGGRNSALSSEIGFAYNRSLSDRRFEISGRIAYSTLNILAGGLEIQDSLGNDTGVVLRKNVGANGISLGGAMFYFKELSAKGGPLVGLEANYTFTRFHSKVEVDGQDRFDLSKFTTSLLVGYRVLFEDHFELDVLFGVGVAFKNFTWNSTESQSGNLGDSSWNWSQTWDLAIEPTISAAFPIVVRAGYRF